MIKIIFCLYIWLGSELIEKGQWPDQSYPAGPGRIKKGKTMFIVFLSGRAGNFKRKAKSCLLFSA